MQKEKELEAQEAADAQQKAQLEAQAKAAADEAARLRKAAADQAAQVAAESIARTPGGVLISWYKKRGLDPTDPNIDREDPDHDGFSNITEYKNEPVGVRYDAHKLDGSQSTDPNDPKSHPPYLSRLRLQKCEPQPFHIYFNGYEQLNGVYLFQFHLSDEPSTSQPQLKKIGDHLYPPDPPAAASDSGEMDHMDYVIGPFHEAHQDVTDDETHATIHRDVSTLELDQAETGMKVIVPFRTEINVPDVIADFVMLMPTETEYEIRVPVGKTFILPPYIMKGIYLVKEAGDDGATIVEQPGGKTYHILKLEDWEWKEVPVPPK